jgi:glycosyltransferase 2 family protein
VFTRIKPYLQYVVILALTVLLVWLSLRNLHVEEGTNKLDYLLHTWEQAHKGWLLLMAGLAFLSHIIRAQRWRMLLAPTGNHLKLTHSFYSLMIGYLVNLVIPRGGEVSRCYNLYKLDKIPADVSFGTVVIERIVDVLCL